jgi:hypothetical protein
MNDEQQDYIDNSEYPVSVGIHLGHLEYQIYNLVENCWWWDPFEGTTEDELCAYLTECLVLWGEVA